MCENFSRCLGKNCPLIGRRLILRPVVNLKTVEKDFNDAMMPYYSIKDFSADVLKKRNAWS